MSSSSSRDDEISKLHKVYRTVSQMLDDRGYLVDGAGAGPDVRQEEQPDDDNLPQSEDSSSSFPSSDSDDGEDRKDMISRAEFIAKFGEQFKREHLTMKTHKRDDPNQHIMVFFPEEPKVGVKTIREVVEKMRSENVLRAIMVVELNLTPSSKKGVQEISSKFHIEVFLVEELLYNVMEHKFVPHHQVLTEMEKKEKLEQYKIKDTQLPRILVSDPVARYYGLKRGQVVKIIRKSKTAGKYTTYRCTV